ncbi:MAG: penicillin-binding transpeptidase domain-containing protein [bacterium]
MHNYVYGTSAPRGRILDINGNVLVDNKEVYVINYVKSSEILSEDEINIAYKLTNLYDLKESATDSQVINFYLLINGYKNLLTEDELILLDERKITIVEARSIAYDRVDLSIYDERDKKMIYFFWLMNSGYNYDKKEILFNISYEDFARISEALLPGILCETSYVRYYPYKDTLSSIFGSVGPIYSENIDDYLENDYQTNDVVGNSYLEYTYESILRGEKAIYKIGDDNNLILIKEEVPGSDLYLSIDIDVQLELESLVQSGIVNAKNYPNTKFFTDAYAAVSDPITGKIIAMTGQRLIDNSKDSSFTDITSEIINASYTVGSTIKAASITVGYLNDLINYDEYILDSCVKLYLVPEKCSWKELGELNDVSALKYSSNYYQYLIAIKLTGNKYSYNMSINATEKHFDEYRNTFLDFGLGSLTGIDLPGEGTGVTGNIIADDLLLNLAIGQYDTYTLLQILQYINTVSNDYTRVELSLADSAYNINGEKVYEKTNEILNTIDISKEDYKRIITGLSSVITGGTGYGYFDFSHKGAGKTGTSESFLDTNNDGIYDTKTYTRTFAGYAPYDDPKYSIAIITPHIGYSEGEEDEYVYNMSRDISLNIMNFLFQN